MPDARLQRTRATLPEGYQYGDAVKTPGRMLHLFIPTCFGFCIPIPTPWRATHENAAEQLKRRQQEGVAAFGEHVQASMFRLGVDTCATCGTKGKYDCPDCGIPFYANRNQQRTGDEAV